MSCKNCRCAITEEVEVDTCFIPIKVINKKALNISVTPECYEKFKSLLNIGESVEELMQHALEELAEDV
jgi:hypothetical protein